jgi:hypothetical protein
MNATFSILSRTETAITAACASAALIATVCAVLALFASAAPDVSRPNHTVFETVVITAARSA